MGFFRAGLDWSCGLSCGALVKEDVGRPFFGGNVLKMTCSSVPGDSGKTVLCTSASAQLGSCDINAPFREAPNVLRIQENHSCLGLPRPAQKVPRM